MTKAFATLAALLSLIATASLAAEIKVAGGGAACAGFITPLSAQYETETGVVINVEPSTPGEGLIELDEGYIDIATGAVSFDEMVKESAEQGVVIDPSLFTVRYLGKSRVMAFTHNSNEVQQLSRKQLRDVFSSTVTNWKQVGGADREIIVVWGRETPGQNEIFRRLILNGGPVTLRRHEATDYFSIRDFVAKNPGAIGIGPEGFMASITRNPKIPLIVSPVIAVTKKKPAPLVEEFLLYAQDVF